MSILSKFDDKHEFPILDEDHENIIYDDDILNLLEQKRDALLLAYRFD